MRRAGAPQDFFPRGGGGSGGLFAIRRRVCHLDVAAFLLFLDGVLLDGVLLDGAHRRGDRNGLLPSLAAHRRLGGGARDDVRVVHARGDPPIFPLRLLVGRVIVLRGEPTLQHRELSLERDRDPNLRGVLSDFVHVLSRPGELLRGDHDLLELVKVLWRRFDRERLLRLLHPRRRALLPRFRGAERLLFVRRFASLSGRALDVVAQPLELRDGLPVEHDSVRRRAVAQLGAVTQARRPVRVTAARDAAAVKNVPADRALAVVRAVRVLEREDALRLRGGVQRGVEGERRGVRVRPAAKTAAGDVRLALLRHRRHRELLRDVPLAPHDAVREQLLSSRALVVSDALYVRHEPLRHLRRRIVRCDDARELVVAQNARLAVEPVPLHGVVPEPEPVRGGEAHLLGDVEPAVEPGVVRLRERHDEFARFLVRAVHRDAVVLQQRRRQHRDEGQHQIRLRGEQIRGGLLERLLERVRAGPGDAVPRLRRARVVVIDRVQHVVFVPPTKRRKRAPDVHQRRRDPRNVLRDLAQQRRVLAALSRDVVQIPRVLRRGDHVVRPRISAARGARLDAAREPAAVGGHVDVAAVVHVDAPFAAFLDHLPERFLDVCGGRLREGVLPAEERLVEVPARLFEIVHRERLPGVEPKV